MSTIDQLEEAHATIGSLLRDLREQHPDELALIDAQIATLHERRSALLGWKGDQPGDWSLAREIARARGVAGSSGWGKAPTEAWWSCEAAFTVGEMTTVFGDNWTHVVALVRKAASLTSTERSAYYAAWGEDYRANVSAYEDAWRAVFVFDGPCYAARRALRAFVDYVGVAGVGAALARRSEVDTKHYDVRTRVWRRMFGPIHPDDPATV